MAELSVPHWPGKQRVKLFFYEASIREEVVIDYCFALLCSSF